jgi:hypothetical protein
LEAKGRSTGGGEERIVGVIGFRVFMERVEGIVV